jgi:exodeoxyribonuclease V beta subunit
MNDQFEIFDAAALTFTKGINLVEASAGTGKTYSITMLVLRALIELDIPVDKFLIVTYTKAATEELQSRIRERLVETRELLAADVGSSLRSPDATVSAWLATVADRTAARRKLELALQDIDRAGIFTIHGFCQRMLAEQALESGQLFQVELRGDLEKIRQQVAEDFWRSHIYSMPALSCAVITAKFASPRELLASVALCSGGSRIEPVNEGYDGQAADNDLMSGAEAIADWWKEHNRELFDCFTDAVKQGYFKKNGIAENYILLFDEMHRFAAGDHGAYPERLQLLSRNFLVEELNGSKLRGAGKKQAFLAAWPLADELVEQFVEMVQQRCLMLRLQLAASLHGGLQNLLEQRREMGYDDLITRLSSSLEGGNGASLKKAIGDRYRMALIDEFQDTDAQQYHIFSSLFGAGGHYLYLIGDPKQAIYKFRGADINSYFMARGQAGRCLTLNRNYRSHPYPIDEINRLFSSKEKPFALPEEVLSYQTILAARKAGEIDLRRENSSLAGVRYCQLPLNVASRNGRWGSQAAGQAFISFTVAEIISLLGGDSPVSLVNGDSSGGLNPRDIAILVRSNKQAEIFRTALVTAGVPAVVASKHSVYVTGECLELSLLLSAVANPGSQSRMRTAMTIPWFGFTGDQLYRIWNDDEKAAAWHERFAEYNRLWLERGFLFMMNRLLLSENVYPNLARRPLAERSIANISQLLELVQDRENSENLGPGQLLGWLQTMMQSGGEGDDDQLLLESDEDAVQLVTMHGAKGLEYSVVFCPYLWYRSNMLGQEKFQIKSFDRDLGMVVDLGSEFFEQRRALALEEEIAEDLRLLYVAMTRAKVLCYVMWADIAGSRWVSDSFQSALGYLLFSGISCSHEEQVATLAGIAENTGVEHCIIPAAAEPAKHQLSQSHGVLSARHPSDRSLQTDWQISSFSSLAALSEYGLEQTYLTDGTAVGTMIPLPRLPAGPQFGNLVHDLLEENRFSSIAGSGGPVALQARVQDKCSRYGLTCGPQDICSLLNHIVTSPLPVSPGGSGFSLADVAEEDCLKEVNFYFQVDRFTSRRINDILKHEKTCVPLSYKQMKGYLTGFVDLLCRFEGKYYIVDYKTNYLGDKIGDYAPDRLVEAMAAHNYGLQYWIYTLAVHRHLANFLQDYSYHSDFGGVVYLFARGMSPEYPGYGVFSTVPDYGLLTGLEEVLTDD